MRRQVLLTIWLVLALGVTGVVGPEPASANPEGGFSLWMQRAYNAARQGHLSRGGANIRFPQVVARWFTGGVPEEQIVHVGDLDGDGVLEQVGIDGGRVLALRPDLSVAWTSDLILAERIWDIVDLDGDGVGEVLVSGDGSMFVLSGADGAVQFTFGFTEPTLEIEDLDGDGSLEILVRNARENPGVRAYTFAGGVESGALAWQTLTNIPDGPFDLAVGDVDGDAQTWEVLLDDRDGGRVVVLAGDDGRLLRQSDERVIQGDFGCGPSLVANLDGDDQQEFIYSGSDVGPRASAFIATYDFADDEIQWSYEFGNNGASSALRLPTGAVADLNGDGRPELVASVFNNTREVTGGQPADLDGVFQPGVWSLIIYDGETGEAVDFRTNLVASAVVALDAEGSLAILAQTAGRSIETGAPDSGVEALVLSEAGELETLWTLPRAALLSKAHKRLTTCSPGDGPAPLAIADVDNDGRPEALVARHLDDDGDPEVLQLVSLGLQVPRIRAERDLASHHRPLIHDMGRGMLPDKAHLAVQLGDGFLTIFDELLVVQSRAPLTRHLAEPRVVNGVANDAEFRRVLVQQRTSELALLDVSGPGLRPSPVWLGDFEEIPQPMVAVRSGGSSRIVHLTRDGQGNPLIEALDALGEVRWSRALLGSRRLPTGFTSGKFDLNDGDELLYIAHDDEAGARLEMVDGGTGEVRQTRLLNELDEIDDTAEVIMLDFGPEVAPDFLIVDGDSAFLLDGDLTPVTNISIGIGARFSTAADFDGGGDVEIFSNAGVDRKALLDLDGEVVWEIPIEGDDHTWRDDVQTWSGVVDTDAGPGLEIAVAGRAGDLTLLNGATGEVVWRVCLSGGEALLMPDGAPRVDQCDGARLSDITSGNIITDSQDPELERQELAFGAEDGWLYVLEAESGAVAWAMDFGAAVGAPLLTDPLLTDTLSLVVPVANGDVYTIRAQFPPVSEVRDVATAGNRVVNRDVDEDELETVAALGVAWEPIQGANGYKVAILSDDGGGAQALTEVGQRTDAVITDLDLEIGRTYRALVVAYDAQQRDGAVTSSDGLLLSDLTDPEIVAIASSAEAFNPSRDPDVRLTGEATDNLGLASMVFEARREGDDAALWTERFEPEGALSFQAVAGWDGRTDADGAAPDGLYEVTLTATDIGDNVASASVQVLLDATAPDAPVITEPVDGALVTEAQVTIRGLAEAGARVEVELDGEVACAVEASQEGAFECTPEADLAEGEHVVTAKATDALGNTSEAATPVAFIVDLLPPDAPVITTPEDGEVFETASPTFEGEAEINSEVTVELVGAGEVCTTTTDAQGVFSCTPVAGIAAGQHEVFARATDRAGRISEPSASVKFSIAGDEPEPEGTPDVEPEGQPEGQPEGNPEEEPSPIVTTSPEDDCACSTPARPARAPWAPMLFAALGLALLLRRRA